MAPTPEKKPDAFLSYTRFDNEFSGGAISIFRDQLAAHVRALTGKPFYIFQDADGIGLGEHWPKKLDDMLNEARFFMPILTPSFFESKPCRKELQSFLDAEAKAGRVDLILPIYWTECELLDVETLRSEDPLAVILHERQHHDWRHLAFEPSNTNDYRASMQTLARKIRDASKRRQVRVNLVEPSRATKTLVSDPLLLPPGTAFRDLDEPWCPEMVVIPPGVFTMGSSGDEAEREDSEGPQHRVQFDKPFALGRYPVTRGEFAAFVKETGHAVRGAYVWSGSECEFDQHADWQAPGFAQTDLNPVVCVSNEDAIFYLDWLSQKTGRRYVLPSEAMWEYACRAGTTTPFWTGRTITTDQANYHGDHPYGDGSKGLFRKATTEVNSFAANPFGLHDMHGNVFEWCADRWHESYRGAPTDGTAWLDGNEKRRVVRGGNFVFMARGIRSASRSWIEERTRDFSHGFRCATA